LLTIACARGYSDLVKALLDKGAAPDERDADDQGPLFFACASGKNTTVRHLIKAGVSPSSTFCGPEKVPAIVVAASRGNLPVIQELLTSGAWLDEADVQGHTALHTACFTGSPQVAIFLIDKGANFNLMSKKGQPSKDDNN
jgi:ankyrin repeat protein